MTQNTQETTNSAATAASAEPVSAPAPKPKTKPGAGRRRAKKILKTVITLLVIAGILGGGGVALYRFLNTSEEQVSEIYAVPAYIGSITSSASGSGSARSKETAAITLTSTGTVQELFVTAGQMVTAGQPLYTMTSPAALETVAAAQMAVDRAQENVAKAQKQVTEAQEQVTKAEERVTEAQKQVTTAEAYVARLQEEMEKLRSSMDELIVTAPYAGKIIEVTDLQLGARLSSGTQVATLVNDKTLLLTLYFSYAYESSIYVDMPVTVTIPAVMGSYAGKVEKINKVSYITPEGGKFFEVVISFANEGTLTAGMDASATMTAADGSAIYPYKGGKLSYSDIRAIVLKAGGSLLRNDLLKYADVTAGQVLMELGPEEKDELIEAKQKEIDTAQEGVTAAQNGVKEAREGVTRTQEGVTTAMEGVTTAQEAVVKAEEELAKAEEALTLLNAEAPIDGTIVTCTLAEGQEAKGGETVIIISNNTTMLVDITVDDKNISFLHPGDYVDLDWNGMIYQGQITAINMGNAQQGQGMTRYPVTLSVENWDGSLMDGAWLQYSFVTSQSDECVLVPSGAVRSVSDADGNRCYVVFIQRDERPDDVPELDLPERNPSDPKYPTEEEGYYPVIVETGISDTQNVEIKSGIEVGDTVFVSYSVQSGSWG